MKTLYLLGAGASASNTNIIYAKEKKLQYIPTVASFPDAIEFLLETQIIEIDGKSRVINFLESLNIKLKEYLRMLLKGTKAFGTPDTYAKSLLLKHGPNSEQYCYTKMAISFVIQAIQAITTVDPRYYQFFSALLYYNRPTEGKLHEHVYIATWNYDLQLNESLTSLLGVQPKDVIKSGINFHGIRSKEREYDEVVHEKRIFRINGYAGSVIIGNSSESHQDFQDELNTFYDRNQNMDEKMKSLVNYYNSENAHSNQFFINFAWDENNASKSEINGLEAIAETIKCLVVIGYSFPIYNRDIDMKIIKKLKNLAKVYVQDRIDHTYKIKEYLKAAHSFNSSALERLVVYENNCDQFLVPNELYA